MGLNLYSSLKISSTLYIVKNLLTYFVCVLNISSSIINLIHCVGLDEKLAVITDS